MKRIILGAALIALSASANAQQNKLVSAWSFMNDGELDRAKKAIDAASVHAKTSEKSKTWKRKGKIYMLIHESTNADYKALDPNAIEVSKQAYEKAFSCADAKKLDMDETNSEYIRLAVHSFERGRQLFNDKDYAGSAKFFQYAVDVNGHFNVMDTLALFNVGFASEIAKDFGAARAAYEKCKSVGYGGADMFVSIAKTHKTEGNVDLAMAELAAGRAKYPTDQKILLDEINMFIQTKQPEKALGNLNTAIKNDPKNADLLYARGTIFQDQGNMENAIKDFEAAIVLNSSSFGPNYNLGALFFNEGAKCLNEIPETVRGDAYQKAKAKCEAMIKKSIPYLEKAHSIDPKDVTTMRSLKDLYGRTNQPDKYNEMKAKLEN